MEKRPARWPEDSEEALEKYIKEGKTIDEIAKLLSKTYAAVHNKMVRMKLISLYDKIKARTQEPKRGWTTGEDKRLKKDFKQKTNEALAEELGRTVHEARKRLEYLGLRRRHHWTKEEAEELKQLTELTQKEIQEKTQKYGISEAALRRKWIRLRQAQTKDKSRKRKKPKRKKKSSFIGMMEVSRETNHFHTGAFMAWVYYQSCGI